MLCVNCLVRSVSVRQFGLCNGDYVIVQCPLMVDGDYKWKMLSLFGDSYSNAWSIDVLSLSLSLCMVCLFVVN